MYPSLTIQGDPTYPPPDLQGTRYFPVGCLHPCTYDTGSSSPMRTQVRMSEPMGARLTRHLASPLVVATPGRVAPWLRVKTAHPEEGREGRREREREREREGRDSCTSQREETKRKEQRSHTALSRCRKKKKRKNRRRGEKRREFAPV